MNPEQKKHNVPFLLIVVISIIAVITACVYFFMSKRDFTYVIEAPCTEGSLCFVRDCEAEECPPNGLSEYRVFEIKALDFKQCSMYDSCATICTENPQDTCHEVVCDAELETCSNSNQN